MSEASRASEALTAVLERLPSKFAPDLRVLDSWVENEETICVIYASSLTDGVTGLRRQTEADIPVEAVVDDTVVCDLGEPLGANADGLIPMTAASCGGRGGPRVAELHQPGQRGAAHEAII